MVAGEPEAEVAGTRVGRLRVSRGDAVAPAVRRVAQVGAAPADGARVALGPGARTPLPDVPRGVVEAEPVGREGVDRAGAAPAVRSGVVGREGPLPDVHAVLAARLELRAPGERLPDQPAAGGVLPLGLGGQA